MNRIVDCLVILGLDSHRIQPEPKQADWIQLSGHANSFAFGRPGILCKKCEADGHEALAYDQLIADKLRQFVPAYHGTVQLDDECFIIIENLLSHFDNPNIMDIKMGTRTFLEEEISNDKPRPDLYEKLVKIDTNGLTEEEKKLKAVTKSKYMIIREQLSSSSTLGFRIEAFKTENQLKAKDLSFVKSREQVKDIFRKFFPQEGEHIKKVIERLYQLRSSLKTSTFFASHELVGSSLLIVYDKHKIGVWMIDFAKTVPLPDAIEIDHCSPWLKGNHEDGYLFGVENLINILEEIMASHL